MRHCHYWKPAGPARAPANILVFDTETWHAEHAQCDGGEVQRLRLGCALAYRLEDGKRTREKELTFKEPQAFWELVASRLQRTRPLWIVAHNLAYDWGVVGGWSVLASERFYVQKAAVSANIFFMKGLLDRCPVVLVDTFNYYRVSLRVIGDSLGFPKLGFPSQSEGDDVWQSYCSRDVQVTALALDSLIQFTRSEKLGPWQPSIAGLAFSGFRSRFMKHKVLVHDNYQALRVERSAYYGGLVDTPRIGLVPSKPIHELDVCSMYPAVCRNPLPTKLKKWTDRIGPRLAKKLLGEFLCIADVSLKTRDTPYPVKLKDGTYYPVGQFRTCLAHPELEQAFRMGHVDYIHSFAWYESAPIFAEYMQWAIDRKTYYSKQGNKAWRTLCKYYGTNLYGKTGQTSPQWREWGAESMARLEERYGLYPGTLSRYVDKPPHLYALEETLELEGVPEAVEVREYYGTVEVRCGEGESRDSCPVIAATVTSYARQLMRKFQAIAGSGNWYYTDTDSIWTNDEGRKRLEDAGCVGDEVLGLLKVEKTHKAMVVHGPKDYETDCVRRLKGVKASAEPTDSGGWAQLQFPSPLIQIRDNLPGGVFVRKVVKHLKRTITKCVVQSDGTTRPLRFPAERPGGKSFPSSGRP